MYAVNAVGRMCIGNDMCPERLWISLSAVMLQRSSWYRGLCELTRQMIFNYHRDPNFARPDKHRKIREEDFTEDTNEMK